MASPPAPRPFRTFSSLGLLALGMLVMLDGGCDFDAPKKPKPPSVLEVVMDGPADEGLSGEMLAAPKLSHREVLRQLHSVADDARLRGLFLRLGDLGSAWARAEDLKRALAAIRAADKPVHCHFEGTDNLGYAVLAGHCDEITMTPAGMLNLVGLRARGLYAKQALDMLGLSAEMLHAGKYKGAADMFTLDAMPETARETFEDMLDDLHATLAASLALREGIEPGAIQGLLDAGPYNAGAARKAGLVDRVAFDDEARQRIRTAAGVERVERAPTKPKREETDLSDMLAALTGDKPKSKIEGPHLAVAYLTGTIVRGGPESHGGAEAESFVRKLRKWADDGDVRAVLIRIHSPGGSALASDLMWQAVRRVAGRKPVVASIGDMAASGGYYVASGATEIFAEEGSLVGSIGVVGGKIVAQELATRMGVHSEVIRRGARSNWHDPLSRFDDDERAAVQEMLDSTYRLFVRRVAEGRSLEAAQVEEVAQGRLMTGRRGKPGRLVDTFGGLRESMARARELGNLPADAKLEVWPDRESLLDQIASAMGNRDEDDDEAAAALRTLLPARLDPWRDFHLLSLVLGPDRGPAALLPYGVDIR